MEPVTFLDIVGGIVAPILALAWLPIAACNLWYAFRSIVRNDTSSPSPMPLMGSVVGVMIACFIPGLAGRDRLLVGVACFLLSDGPLVLEGLLGPVARRLHKRPPT